MEILIEDKGTAPLLVVDELDNLKECGDESTFVKMSVSNGEWREVFIRQWSIYNK